MISKLVDVFFFLVFKVSQTIWDKLSANIATKLTSTPNGNKCSPFSSEKEHGEALELLGNRFDHFEDLLYQLKEASQ